MLKIKLIKYSTPCPKVIRGQVSALLEPSLPSAAHFGAGLKGALQAHIFGNAINSYSARSETKGKHAPCDSSLTEPVAYSKVEGCAAADETVGWGGKENWLHAGCGTHDPRPHSALTVLLSIQTAAHRGSMRRQEPED